MSISDSNEETQYSLKNRTNILPYPLSRGSAVWVEEQECIYIFGGRNKTAILDSIMKYSPEGNELEILNTKLPCVLMGTTAVYDDTYVYIFGGRDYDRFYDTILKFDPKTELITKMTSHLPKPTVGASGIWTGKDIYLFGGCWGGVLPQKFDSILRFNPMVDNITIMNSTLSYGRSGSAATWNGEYIYIVGGSDGRKYSAEVFRYSPKNDTIDLMQGILPSGRLHTQVEYFNDSLFIFGGRLSHTNSTDQILRYDFKTNEVLILEQKLPTPTELRMHAYDGVNIYIIGGFDGPHDFNQFIIFTFNGESIKQSDQLFFIENFYHFVFVLVLSIIILIIIITKYWIKKD